MRLVTTFAFLGVMALLTTALAGGPLIEIPKARVSSVEQSSNGWSATVSGIVQLWGADPHKPEKSRMIELIANDTRLVVPVGNQLYTLRDPEAYERRLRAAVGSTQHIQIWGGILTLDGAIVTQIVAGDISLLRPNSNEAAFDIRKLKDIAIK